jgi:PAS domain S-box-containing protein
MLAHLAAEVPGQTIYERYAEMPERLARMERALRGESFTGVFDYGELRLHSTYHAMRDEETGDLDGFIVASVDISDRLEAERVARERDELLRAVISTAPVMLLRVDREGRFVFFGGSAELQARVTPEDVVGETIYERYAQAPERLARMERALRGESFSEIVDYDDLRMFASFQPVRDDQTGEPDGFVVTSVDITDRMKAERALEVSERMLNAAEGLAHLGSWWWDIRRDEFTLSDETYRFLADEPREDERTYAVLLDRIHPDDREAVDEGVRRALEDDEPFNMNYRLVRPDGEIRVVDGQAVVERDEQGEPVTMTGTVHDITERVAAERALEASEQMLNAAQRIAHLGSWQRDIRTSRLSLSDEAYRILGEEPRERGAADVDLVGDLIDRVHPEDRETARHALRKAFEDSEPISSRYRIIRPDGKIRVIDAQGALERDEQGRPAQMTGTIHDITERLAADAALRERDERIRAVIDAGLTTIFRVDREGVITFSGGSALWGSGVEADVDWAGLHYSELVREPEQTERIERALAGESLSEVIQYRGQSLLAKFNVLRDGRGESDGFVAVYVELPEREKA